MIRPVIWLSVIWLPLLACLTATTAHAQLFQTNTADQMMSDAEQKAISDPQSACIGFQQAANLYRALSQNATQQANAISPNDQASRKMELNRIADEAFRGELMASARARQVCNIASQPAPKDKPKS